MIKDAKGSNDGWFWGEFYFNPKTGKPMPFDDHAYPFNYPAAGFGLYCTRCHASAEKELTFASLTNIQGFPGDPLTFRVDDSWRAPAAAMTPAEQPRARRPTEAAPLAPVVAPNPSFLQTFRALGPIAPQQVVRLPNETWDLVVAPAGGKAPFVTSNQCQGCHSAAIAPFGPTMYLPAKENNGINVSPYTEWRWSPMGLAGRDPIFFAQLESELAYLDEVRDPKTRADLKQTVVDTCFRCHGVMGKRQHDIDVPGGHFSLDYIQRTGSEPGARYGALARDGISCAACHRITRDTIPPDWKKSPLEYFLTQLDHRTLPDRPAGSDLRSLQGRGDRHGADEQRARRQAGVQPLHQERADVRELSHDQPAGARQAADRAGRPEDDALDRAGDVSRMAQQRVSERVRPAEPEGARPARTVTCPAATRARRAASTSRRSRRASRSSRTRPIRPRSIARPRTTFASASARRGSSATSCSA